MVMPVTYSYKYVVVILHFFIKDHEAKNFAKSLIYYYLSSFAIRNKDNNQIYCLLVCKESNIC